MATKLQKQTIPGHHLIGTYALVPGTSNYYSNTTATNQLLIGTRETEKNPRKPSKFLLFIDELSHRHYISSLWLKSPGNYEFEYTGTRYQIETTGNKLEVQLKYSPF